MAKGSIVLFCLLALVCASSLVVLSLAYSDRVLLTEIKTLTFFGGRQTTARRTSPIPQLRCIGSSELCNHRYYPSAVQCYNMGTDGNDVQWRCEAELDEEVAFDAVHVSCEGYAHPDDPFVLDGSCGLEYKLKWTNVHHDRVQKAQQEEAQRRASQYQHRHQSEGTTSYYTDSTRNSDEDSGSMRWVLYLVILVAVIWFCTCRKSSNASTMPPRRITTLDSDEASHMAMGAMAGAAAGATAAHFVNRANQTQSHSSYSSTSSSSSSSPKRNHTSTGFGTTSKR